MHRAGLRACSTGVDAVEQGPSLGGAAVIRAESGQAGVVRRRRELAGLGVTAQAQEGGGRGQFNGAGFRAVLLLGQAAAQFVGALRFGESVLVAVLATQAAGQPETQDQVNRSGTRWTASAWRASASASG